MGGAVVLTVVSWSSGTARRMLDLHLHTADVCGDDFIHSPTVGLLANTESMTFRGF